jgi:hypothetical protein
MQYCNHVLNFDDMSNLTNNRIDTVISDADLATVNGAIDTIETTLSFLIGLTVDERIQLPKINVANKSFTQDAINAVVNNGTMLPAYLNQTAMQKDMNLYNQLDKLAGRIRQVLEKIDDTQMLAGSEAFVAALTAYKLFSAAAAAGIPGSDAIYDTLRERFAGQGGSGANPPIS